MPAGQSTIDPGSQQSSVILKPDPPAPPSRLTAELQAQAPWALDGLAAKHPVVLAVHCAWESWALVLRVYRSGFRAQPLLLVAAVLQFMLRREDPVSIICW